MVYEMKKTGQRKKRLAVPEHKDDCFLCQSCQAECPVDAIIIEW
jgi:NAD-dependent dihydropyrimidine dehydrogenase PreA subunit